MSPRSSVTWWLSSGRSVRSGQARSMIGRSAGGIRQPSPKRGGRRGGAGGRRGAGAPADAVEPGPELGGDGRVELRRGVADDPRAVAVVGGAARSRLARAGTRPWPRRSTRGERAKRPRQRLLDVRLGVADEVGRGSARPWRGDLRVAAAAGGRRGHRRDRRADEAALPARRRVDELLELRPAVRLARGCPWPRVGEGVDGDPVAGLARGSARTSCQVRSGSSASVRSRRPKASQWSSSVGPREQAVGDERAAASRRSLAGGVPEAARDRGEQRPADAEDRADARARSRCWPSRYSGSASRSRPGARARRRSASGSSMSSASARARAPRPPAVRSATKRDGALGRRARRSRRRGGSAVAVGRRRADAARRPPVSGVALMPSRLEQRNP